MTSAEDFPDDMSALVHQPIRMWLTNIDTTEEMTAHCNPAEIEEKLTVNYARLAVMGLSHQPLQYQNTSNQKLDFTLLFRWAGASKNRVKDMKDAKKFIYSLCYAKRGASTIAGGAPPRVLFIWPNYAALTCVIVDLGFRTVQFARDGSPLISECKVQIEEIRDVRLFSDDVREVGLERAGGGEGGSDV